jgi:hypothetical protein
MSRTPNARQSLWSSSFPTFDGSILAWTPDWYKSLLGWGPFQANIVPRVKSSRSAFAHFLSLSSSAMRKSRIPIRVLLHLRHAS